MKRFGWGIFVAACVGGPIIAMIALGAFGGGEVTGELRGSGPLIGDFTLKADACGSGEPDGFLGVYLGATDRSDVRLKAFQDPIHGRLVQLQVPGSCEGPRCRQVILNADTCDRFNVRIEKTSTTINDVRVLDGAIGLDCALASGDRITGEMTFEGCH